MNLEGERRLPAAIDLAWAALNDPAALKACITGCESLELTGEDEYTAVMAVRIGPVNAKFKGRLRLLNVQPPTSYTIEFDGQGGVAGFGKGAADVALTPEGDEFGRPVTTEVRSAAYALAAQWVVIGLFAVLVVLLGVNVVRRRRTKAGART